MDLNSSTASVNIRYRIKESKQLSLIITLLNIVKPVMSCRKYGCYIHQGAVIFCIFKNNEVINDYD